MNDLIGSTIGGCTIESLLGQGGMGAVYKGAQESLQRPVALKVLPDHLEANDEFIQRFMREAMIVAKINHPNIIQKP